MCHVHTFLTQSLKPDKLINPIIKKSLIYGDMTFFLHLKGPSQLMCPGVDIIFGTIYGFIMADMYANE